MIPTIASICRTMLYDSELCTIGFHSPGIRSRNRKRVDGLCSSFISGLDDSYSLSVGI